MKRKEIFWLIGTLIICFLIHFSLDGFDSFTATSTLDFNVHDSYFVIPNIFFFLLLTSFIVFGVYLVRMLRRNFKNLFANVVFMISSILVILILVNVITTINSLAQIYSSMDYSNIGEEVKEQTQNRYNNITNAILIIQLIILLLLTYCGYKTGRNYKHRAKNTMHNNGYK